MSDKQEDASSEKNEDTARGGKRSKKSSGAVAARATDESGEQGEDAGGRWPADRLAPVVEALIFAAGDALPVRQICKIVAGATAAEVKAAIAALEKHYAGRGCRLAEVAGGWQFRTAPEHHGFVKQLFKERPFRLTRAGIETLSIVAYKQPVTRAEVEAVRGVDCSGVLESLVERHVVRIAGRRDVPGRPLVYATTPVFLETFGLKDIKALPTLAELGSEIGGMADAAGFAEQGEDAAARVIPLEEGDDGGDNEAQQQGGAGQGNQEPGAQPAEEQSVPKISFSSASEDGAEGRS